MHSTPAARLSYLLPEVKCWPLSQMRPEDRPLTQTGTITNTMMSQSTEKQRRLFCEMMYRGFLDMRGLGLQGKSEQAAALADAFHNLPIAMFQPEFDWGMSRAYFQSYHTQYPPQSGAETNNYVASHDRIQASV